MALAQFLPVTESAAHDVVIREAKKSDLDALNQLEQQCFANDRLSRRQFKHWIQATNRVLLVAEQEDKLLAYGLVIMRKGTRMARLYSLAVDGAARGLGLGKKLLLSLEESSLSLGKHVLRLEVAKHNAAAISLYQSLDYKIFGIYQDYYDDHSDALRMEKAIKQRSGATRLPSYPWYQQTTDFTCGPAALMMAMASLDQKVGLSQELELDLWRIATTIFMTSGHGGCHPLGLAIAARQQGFDAQVYISQPVPLFVSGVRSEHKKQVLEAVEHQFLTRAEAMGLAVHHHDISIDGICQHLKAGHKVLSLISTYSLDGYKAPHWVTITAFDDTCFYLHDPQLDPDNQVPMDCQYIPVAFEDFPRLSAYGKSKLRAAVVIARLD